MKDAFDAAAVAIFIDDMAALKAALATPGLAQHRVDSGHSTLLQMVACEAHNIPNPAEATRLLVEAGAETTWPLISAAGCDAHEVVSTLLDLGAAVDADHPKWTPLDEALYWNNAEIAQLLVDRGADPRRLRRASGLGDVDATRSFFNGRDLLSEAGPIGSPFAATVPEADANDAQHVLDHAFVMAVNCGHSSTGQLLLDYGARIDAQPPGYHWKGTALHAAIWRGETDLVTWLLDEGADPTIRDGLANADPLGWARHHDRKSIATLLETRS